MHLNVIVFRKGSLSTNSINESISCDHFEIKSSLYQRCNWNPSLCCVAQIQFVAFFDGKNKIITTANVNTVKREKNHSFWYKKRKSSSFGRTMSPAFLFQFWGKRWCFKCQFFLTGSLYHFLILCICCILKLIENFHIFLYVY